MDHRERADELEQEADRLEHESDKLGEEAEQARSDWESKKSDPTKAPGAADPDATGPHHIESEDPATGKPYGEERQQEIEDARKMDSAEEADNDST
jgi:hypothetical protein